MSYASEILADSPRAWWRMGEVSGQPQDSSGNGNHTTLTTGTPTYGVAGAIADGNTAISLPGTTGNRFTAPDSSSLHVADIFTLEAWIKLARTSNFEMIVQATTNGFQMDIDTTGKIRFVRNGVGVMCTSTAGFTDTTTWHHVVCTKTGSTVKQYLDGADVTGSVSNQTLGNVTGLIYIGCTSALSFPTQSSLDEIAIYGTALSSARVSAHFAAASVTAASFVPRVIASY
jgi:trimeric autotransporter adhesin